MPQNGSPIGSRSSSPGSTSSTPISAIMRATLLGVRNVPSPPAWSYRPLSSASKAVPNGSETDGAPSVTAARTMRAAAASTWSLLSRNGSSSGHSGSRSPAAVRARSAAEASAAAKARLNADAVGVAVVEEIRAARPDRAATTAG